MTPESAPASSGSYVAPRSTIVMVESARALEQLVRRIAQAAPARIALDVEANGLHAYRASLCVLQLAWPEGDGMVAAIIDPFKAAVAPLAGLFGATGPIKVLHDLTFDARLLDEAGVPVARVRDTSVTARLLGFPATGLSTMLASELGHILEKRFQQHDWAQRPISQEHITYLAGDVLHLLALDDRLAEKAAALGIEAEVACECDYKLASAVLPPRDTRPAYVRIKGAGQLDGPGRAALRHLCEARDRAAESANVPAFKVIGNEVLLELARLRPTNARDLSAVKGATAGRAASCTRAFLRAIATGIVAGDVPPEEQELFRQERPDRETAARRRAREGHVTSWRRAEARRRGVDEQAVLPGHCATCLVDALLAHEPGSPALLEAIGRIPGLGAGRLERYGEAFLELSRVALPIPAAPASRDGAPGSGDRATPASVDVDIVPGSGTLGPPSWR